MLKLFFQRSYFVNRGLNNVSVKRYFLSNAYKCVDTWENRLKNPVFQKIDFDSVYHQLDLIFQEKSRVNVLDIDLFASSLTNYDYKNEVEDILLKLRQCPESAVLPERTSHAVIRWYLQNAPKEDILNVLSDRLNYGLFPDNYLVNLLMDTFLESKDAVSAVKIAVLQMLQEEFEHPITKSLALYSCFYYLASSEIWEALKQSEPDPDEDVKKVRVEFIRNPYFDDHFDIVNPNHLVGKTMWLFGMHLREPLGISSQLIGLVLYEKYEKCVLFLEDVVENNVKIHAEAVEKAKEYALKRPKEVQEEGGDEKKEEGNKEGKSAQGDDPMKTKVLELLGKIQEKNLIKENLLAEAEKLVKNIVGEHEKSDIELQCQIYKKWEEERENHIQNEITLEETKKLKEKIDKAKEELQSEEQKIFFFENEEEFIYKSIDQEKKRENVRFYKAKRMKKDQQDDYIPPEVSQRKK